MPHHTQLVHLQRTSVKSGANVWEAIYSKHDSLFADKVRAGLIAASVVAQSAAAAAS
jgi:hypothetical protein